MNGGRIAAAALVLLLAGCATFSEDGGFNRVSELTRERTGQTPKWQRSPDDAQVAQVRVGELLKTPLTPDSAVEFALLNNPGLQAGFQELGIAEADVVRAGRLRNPTFSFRHLAGGGVREIERAIIFDVLSLLAMPLGQELEQARFAQTQLQIANEAVGVAAEARRAYFTAVASGETGEVLPAGEGSCRRLGGTRAADGAGRQLQQACADARASLLCRCHRPAGTSTASVSR